MSPVIVITSVSSDSSIRAASSACALRASRISVQPRRASSRASARPSPREAPVISAACLVVIVWFPFRRERYPGYHLLFRHTIPNKTGPPLRPTGLISTCTKVQSVREFDQAALRRDGHGFGAITRAKFAQDRTDVELNRALGDDQRGGDLLVG